MNQVLTNTEREQMLENAALLVNFWNGVELDVKARGISRIAKTLVETHYRENDLPFDFAFLEKESPTLGFSVAMSLDKSAYIFRRQLTQYSGITDEDLRRHYELHGERAIVADKNYFLCPTCLFAFDEHPFLGTITFEKGSRFMRLVARGMCSGNVLFEKAVEI